MPPLSKRVRMTTLWLSVLIFIVGTPLLIGYSQGYRLGDALSLIQTGGIYIHSDMANTTVYIDGEFVEDNGVLLKNTLIQNLRPNRTYEVWVEKDEYRSWVKELPVEPNLVTEARVLMLPKNFEWEIVPASTTVPVVPTATSTATSTLVANPVFVSLSEHFKTDRGQFVVDVATTTYAYDSGVRVATSTTIAEVQFPEDLMEFASSSELDQATLVRERDGVVSWLRDGDVYAAWVRREDDAPHIFRDATTTQELLIDWEDTILRYQWYPNRNDAVIVLTERGVYAVELDDRSQRNIQPFIEEPGLTFRILPDDTLVVWDGEVYRTTSW